MLAFHQACLPGPICCPTCQPAASNHIPPLLATSNHFLSMTHRRRCQLLSIWPIEQCCTNNEAPSVYKYSRGVRYLGGEMTGIQHPVPVPQVRCYISAGFTRTANYSESWESRLRHRWLIFQQDSKIVPCKDETLRNLSIAISDETMSFSPSWDGFIIGPLFRLEFSNHSVHNSNHGWSYNLPDILVIILIEPCRKVLPAPHLPEQSQKPSCPSMGTILWLIVITCIILWFRQRAHKSKFPLPPGPPADPIIGHLRYIPPENPEDKIAEWSRQYGRYFWVLVCEAG